MNFTRKMTEMAIILLAVCTLLAPLMAFAADSPPDADAVAAQAVEQASKEIEKTFGAHNPGGEIGKAIGDAMGSMGSSPEGSDIAHQALLIPILGIIGVFIVPVIAVIIIVVLAFRHRDKKEQRNHETIRQMIEKGMEIPSNISFGEAPESGSPLNKGLKYMGTGAGLIVFFLVMGMQGLAGIGAIPLFIGIAYLVIWHLEKRQIVTGKAG